MIAIASNRWGWIKRAFRTLSLAVASGLEMLFALPVSKNGLPFVKPGTAEPTNDSNGCTDCCGVGCTCVNCASGFSPCKVVLSVGGGGNNITLQTSCQSFNGCPGATVASGKYIGDSVNGISRCFIGNLCGFSPAFTPPPAVDFYCSKVAACAGSNFEAPPAGATVTLAITLQWEPVPGMWEIEITTGVSFTSCPRILFYALFNWDCDYAAPVVLANQLGALGTCFTDARGFPWIVMGTGGAVTLVPSRTGTC